MSFIYVLHFLPIFFDFSISFNLCSPQTRRHLNLSHSLALVRTKNVLKVRHEDRGNIAKRCFKASLQLTSSSLLKVRSSDHA